MAHKFRILLKPIETDDRVTDNIVKAICCLHNFLLTNLSYGKYESMLDDGSWRDDIQPLFQAQGIRARGANRSSEIAKNLRDNFAQYFSGKGAVEWQDDLL